MFEFERTYGSFCASWSILIIVEAKPSSSYLGSMFDQTWDFVSRPSPSSADHVSSIKRRPCFSISDVELISRHPLKIFFQLNTPGDLSIPRLPSSATYNHHIPEIIQFSNPTSTGKFGYASQPLICVMIDLRVDVRLSLTMSSSEERLSQAHRKHC